MVMRWDRVAFPVWSVGVVATACSVVSWVECFVSCGIGKIGWNVSSVLPTLLSSVFLLKLNRVILALEYGFELWLCWEISSVHGPYRVGT